MKLKELKANYHVFGNCDMKCSYCFAVRDNKSRGLILETFEMVCEKFNIVNLIGGELFTDIDLLSELVNLANSKGVKVSIVSNGYYISRNLANVKLRSILEKIDTLGISCDSFSDLTNLRIGRSHFNETVDFNDLSNIFALCREIGIKTKLNTVVHSLNGHEDMSHKVMRLQVDKWKVFQVSLLDSNNPLRISEMDFNNFISDNFLDNMVVENSEVISNSYININSKGFIFLNSEEVDPIVSVYDEVSKIEDKLRDSSFSFKNYQRRY